MDLIEIVPLEKLVRAEITVPGSKSITNRALILAALADGEVTLQGALWSEDTQIMVDCLRRLGFDVRVEHDPGEFSNRVITVYGRAGEIPYAGTVEKPLELFVGNAGTAARFLSAMVCLGRGVYRLSGIARMHERPQAAIFRALRELGYRIDSANDKLPVLIHGLGGERLKDIPVARRCRVSIEESSQFASALLLCAEKAGWHVEVTGENAEESPYVAMTTEMTRLFPRASGNLLIEPDASSGSYFWAAGIGDGAGSSAALLDLPIQVRNWPQSGWQIDSRFPFAMLDVLRETASSNRLSRKGQLGDSIMTAITIAPTFRKELRFTDLGRLRVQECERVEALRTELTKCGAKVIETGDTLEIYPTPIHGAEIETYNDHRMAMCFAVLGLRVPGIRLRNPGCVRKTFPDFFQKLAAMPPDGLGVSIKDASGRSLSHDELFAQ